jgi:hypothetical protein
VQVIAAPVRATADIEPALESLARESNGGLILTSDTFTILRGSLIANLAGRYRLPSIASGASFTKCLSGKILNLINQRTACVRSEGPVS